MALSPVALRVDMSDLRRLRRELGRERRVLKRATRTAINRTLRDGRVLAAREIAKPLGARIAPTKRRILVRRATLQELEGQLAASRAKLPLIAFKARQTRAGVTASPGGRRQLERSAFIARMPTSGRKGVFRRRTRRRLPIEQLFGPSIAEQFDRLLDEGLEVRLREIFRRHLDRTIRFFLQRRQGARR